MSLGASGYQSSYSNTGKGKLFIEDVVGGLLRFKQQKVWARQLNPENSGVHLSNNTGRLWILGLKTEKDGIIVESKKGAKTEILGGLIYSTSRPKNTPMFLNEDSDVSITIGECNFNSNFYVKLIEEVRNGIKTTLNRGDTPQHCNGSTIPLYTNPK